MDELADKLGIDRLEFRQQQRAAGRRHRRRPARCCAHSAGLAAMPRRAAAALDAGARRRRRASTPSARPRRGAASASAACGTASATPRCPIPRRMRVGLSPDGTLTLYNGAVDIGQGSQHHHDPDRGRRARPAGRRSSRWSWATPTSPPMPARPRRRARPSSPARRPSSPAQRPAPADPARWPMPAPTRDAVARRRACSIDARRRRGAHASISCERRGDVLMGEGTFDPPTTPLDADGQGVPYATYAFAAQMATVEVDTRARHREGAAHRGRARCRHARSIRPWSRARSRAASPRAWAWR